MQKEILFPRKDPFKLAVLSFAFGGEKYTAEFKTYNGYIVEIIVRPSCKKILWTSKPEITKFRLANDPMEKLDLEVIPEYYDPPEKFTGLLGEIQAKYDLQKVLKPLPDEQRQLFIKLAVTPFPDDYLKLLSQTNGFMIVNEANVFGLGSLESISLEDDNYLTLVQNSDGVLSLKENGNIPELRFHPIDNEEDAEDLGSKFMNALEKFLRG